MRRLPFVGPMVVAALIVAVLLFLGRTERRHDDSAGPGEPGRALPPKVVTGERQGPLRATAPAAGVQTGRSIAIIIDDIGFDIKIVEELAAIPVPMAFAVLPHTPHAAACAGLLHAAGKEILLHLPMEPRSYPEESPGSGALMTNMNGEEIRRRMGEDLAAVPFVSGVNNHMGSRFMKDEARLAIVMEEIRDRDLFFVDSMTGSGSHARKAAARAGTRFAARDVFIDHVPGYEPALKNLIDPFRDGRDNGVPVLMIGHAHPETVRAIRDALPIWQAQGVRVVPLSSYPIPRMNGPRGYPTDGTADPLPKGK